MTAEVRAARVAEYGRVGELTIAAYQTLPVDHLWGGYAEEILDTETRAKGADILVATVDGVVIGSVTYVGDHTSAWSEWTQPGEAQFRLLAVDPAARGKGAGVALVHACVDRARAARQPVVIHTTRWMQTAQRMYERFGFVRTPARDATYEQWNTPPFADVPDAWIGESFLAYALSAVQLP